MRQPGCITLALLGKSRVRRGSLQAKSKRHDDGDSENFQDHMCSLRLQRTLWPQTEKAAQFTRHAKTCWPQPSCRTNCRCDLDRFAHGLTHGVDLRLYPCLSFPEGLELSSCRAVLQPSYPLTITTSASGIPSMLTQFVAPCSRNLTLQRIGSARVRRSGERVFRNHAKGSLRV